MDVATFLRRHPPFDSLDEARFARVAGAVQIEHFPAGAVILRQSGEPARYLYILRKGAVEILDDGRVVDLLSEGEVFGAWSLLAGIGPTASVRAHEDVLCYLIEQELAEEVLGTAGGIAFVLGSLRRRISRVGETYEADRAADQYRPVGVLIRRPAVTCEPSTTVGDAAAIMVRDRVSSLLIPTPDGLGILTDRDLRSRIVAARRDPSTPVAEVMTFPATAVSEDAMAGEVLLQMLELGHHHFPVVDAGGLLKGVITDTDLMGLGRHTPFALKSAIERSRDREEAIAAARDLPQVVATLVDAHADPVGVGHIVGLAIDALTRRLLELGIDDLGDPPVPWAWLALGSAARQEQAILTDQDHAMAYEPKDLTKDEIDPYFAELAEFVTAGSEAAGIPRCKGDAMAANSALRRSVDEWRGSFRGWMTDPSSEGSVLLSIVFDYRRVMGPLDVEPSLNALLRSVPSYPEFTRHLSRRALDDKPPTGFFRDLVVEAKGEHAGRFDIKHGGITIIGNLARAYAIGAGLTEKRTLSRLMAAAAAGIIDEDTRAGLEEAFRFLWGMRLEHHVARIRAGWEPDDFIDPKELGSVTRRGLKEAFKIISTAQRVMASELGVATR